MVMLSPTFGLVTPSPGEIIFLVTPMLIAVRVKGLARVVGWNLVVDGREKSLEACLNMIRSEVEELAA